MYKIYFRILVVFAFALYVFWFYLPWFIRPFYSQDTINALTWSGFGNVLDSQILKVLNYGLFFGYGIICVGLIYFRPWSRIAFLGLVFISIISAFAFGISVLTEPDSFLLQLMFTINGVIIALTYFSGLSKEYENTHNKVNSHGQI